MRPAWATSGVLGVAVAGYALGDFHVVRKPTDGYPQLVRDLLGRPELSSSVMLVAADAAREGAFIAEVAMHERRPGHIVLRSTKALARSTWLGENYQTKFRGPGEVAAYLESIPVSLVAVDTGVSPPLRPHLGQLLAALHQRPNYWRPVHPAGRPASNLRLYRITAPEHPTTARVSREMHPALGRAMFEP